MHVGTCNLGPGRRCHPCLYGFVYYLFCVVVIENVIIVLYWQTAANVKLESIQDGDRNVFIPRTQLNTSHSVNATRALVEGIVAKVHNGAPVGATTTTASMKLAELEHDFYRRLDRKVNPYKHQLIVTPSVVCNRVTLGGRNGTGAKPPENESDSLGSETDTFMIILVHSFHPYVDRRTAIRKTWGSMATRSGTGATWPYEPANNAFSKAIQLVFVLGVHNDPGLNDLVREEAERYDDIVVGDFSDSYRNMTLKSLLGLKLVSEYCGRVQYMLKSDDDMFINVPYLVDILTERTYRRTIMGPFNGGSKVYRNGKWKVTKEEFPFNYYPPYESGSAYIITGDLPRDLLETSEYVPSIFIDDVYITGILGKVLNVTHAHHSGFAFWVNPAPSVCDIIQRRIVTGTKMNPKLMTEVWGLLSSANISQCPSPGPPGLEPLKKPSKL